MDIKDFSKTELIMTALLLSFVTALVTGIVVIFLSEGAPEETIRVSEGVISSNEATSSSQPESENTTAFSTSNNQLPPAESTKQVRDRILDTAVAAVARLSATNIPPQAGVLLETSRSPIVVTNQADFTAGGQALFEDGVVSDLKATAATSRPFALLSVETSSGSLFPLAVSQSPATVGDQLFVVPLSDRPQIVRVSVTAVSDKRLETSAGPLPAVSPLLNQAGQVVGLYDPAQNSFILTTALAL